jgi:hypothetical protein
MDLGILALVGCVLSLVCVGLVAVAAFFGLRFFGGAAADLVRDLTDGTDDDNTPIHRAPPKRKRAMGPVRGQTAAADDFDAQVRQRLQGSDPLNPQGLSGHHGSALSNAQNSTSDDPLGPPPGGDLRSQRTRRRDHDREPYYDDWDMDGDLDLFDV